VSSTTAHGTVIGDHHAQAYLPRVNNAGRLVMTSNPIADFGRGLRVVSALYGILMILFGIAALAAPVISTLATVMVVGFALIAGGLVGLFASFTERKGWAILWNALWAVLALALGIWMVMRPGVGAVSLTMLLGAVLVARGVTGMVLAFDSSFGQARLWLGLGGLLSLVLGGIVLFNLMEMAGLTLGTIVGIDFLVAGFSLLIAAMMGRRAIG
jgi:uncharacterized membrane protein HdeD (DUF308 family)